MAAGLTIAGKQALPASILDDFVRSGTVQVVVLSGYNVTLVAEMITWLCARLAALLPERVGRSPATHISTGLAASMGIILFCIAAGGSATIIRAGIMAVLAIAAKLFHRHYNVRRAFWLAAGGMALWNPLLPLYDPSFQFSFVATAGLLYASPFFLRFLKFLPGRFDLRRTAAATLATQFFVLPLALYETGQLSLVALPTNLLLFLVTPLTMLVTFIVTLVSFALPIVAIVLGWLDWLLLAYQLALVHFFAQLPFAYWLLPPLPFWGMVLLYLLFIVILWLPKNSSLPQTN